ncbi:pirin family protein [Vulcaniibacterium gelatinicum]|uniref:pirin family protein n=1 Tax=Vulcaniibacterium gelatinicum TaxID=2598725 RepID=UPI0011CA312B|nr:pirin family protein [Vulcaniibacterium gelatinicum]
MIVERRSEARGRGGAGWLDSRHTFSFAHYYDPQWMGFSALRVLNEDQVAPGAGFAPHRHANMEIVSYVLSGALAHRDSQGGEGVLRAGELQWMSAGHGIEHGEYNASDREPVHFLQIWIQPDRLNARPAYAQRAFDPVARRGRWATLVAPDGADGALPIRQQAWLHGVRLGAGEQVGFTLDPERAYWLHLAQGEAEVAGRSLHAGDALGLAGEQGRLVLAGRGAGLADVLLFELPPL